TPRIDPSNVGEVRRSGPDRLDEQRDQGCSPAANPAGSAGVCGWPSDAFTWTSKLNCTTRPAGLPGCTSGRTRGSTGGMSCGGACPVTGSGGGAGCEVSYPAGESGASADDGPSPRSI